MRRESPRRETHLQTVETSKQMNYVPKRTREKRRIELFSNRPNGFVIPFQQRIGIEASLSAVERLDTEGDTEGVRNLADVLSVAAIGTAYHTLSTPQQAEKEYSRIPIPEMIDRETDARTTEAELVVKLRVGLANAVQLAAAIEGFTIERRPVRKAELTLGRQLAITGMVAAVIHDGVSELRADEAGMQYESWRSSRAVATHTLEMSGAVGARPTMAQLADDQSPYRRYMYDHKEFIQPHVHSVLLEEIGSSTNDAFRRANKDETLF